MTRTKPRFLLAALALLSSGAAEKSAPTIRPDSDQDPSSSIDLPDYFPSPRLDWPSALGVRSTGDASHQRKRRDLGPEANMDKIAAAKNVREARLMGSPETWSKQPLAVQFRPRTGFEALPLDRYDEDVDEPANLPPPLIRAHHAPKADFVTSGRGRGPPEGREPRDMPIARSYDEYDVPIFRNVVREHDFDVQLPPRNHYYPGRYRSQRDYYYRGAAASAPVPNPYPYDRYREDDEEYELYGNRYGRPATAKPKRIIYYATLPEIVRKPVDLRNYPNKPYEPMSRAPEVQVEPERVKLAAPSNNIELGGRRPQQRYPYDNYDNYVKRSSYYDRRRPAAYVAGNDERARDEERNRSSMKEKSRSDDRTLDNNQTSRSGSDRRLPWPVQIGAEVNVKDSERIPGRKIYGQVENYDRYEGSRVKKDNAERKEDVDRDSKDGNVNNDNNGRK